MTTNIGQETKQSLSELVHSINRDRERLRVQVNLARKELQDDWQVVEKKWRHLEQHLADYSDRAKESAYHVAEEIVEAYRALKDHFDEPHE